MPEDKPVELDIYEVTDRHGNVTTMQLNKEDAEAYGDNAKRVGASEVKAAPTNKSRTASNK